jgi:hypothetical protein
LEERGPPLGSIRQPSMIFGRGLSISSSMQRIGVTPATGSAPKVHP